METIYELIKRNAPGKGEDMMWKSTAIISDAIEKGMPEEARKKLYDELYGLMLGGHYDEKMAEADVAKMFYVDEDGDKHYGPYLAPNVVRDLYLGVRSMIQPYNEWDFYVALHMIVSDNYILLQNWFPEIEKEERVEKYVEMAVNWLTDPDKPSKTRIWDYLH